MSPALSQTPSDHQSAFTSSLQSRAVGYPRKPLALRGALEKFPFEDVTPVIGRKFFDINIVNDLLSAENSGELLRDLAITISQRGVVFFRAQNNLNNDLQKQFIHRLGQQSGKPDDSSLHVHPILNNASEFGVDDPQMSHISSKWQKHVFESQEKTGQQRRYDAAKWHSDIQFESNPADYTSLRLTELPKTGGDTLWASGYELYDRFSRPYQKFLEGLTATFAADGFLAAAKQNPKYVVIHEGPRGAPANSGTHLTAVHPVVRTNPVTGWKSIYALGPFPQRINELHYSESAELLKSLYRAIVDNHDVQVRFKWRNKNDIAIWDNRSVFHTATLDYDGQGERMGIRAVGIAEKPYLDPNSKSRSASLGLPRLGI